MTQDRDRGSNLEKDIHSPFLSPPHEPAWPHKARPFAAPSQSLGGSPASEGEEMCFW